MKPIVVIPTYNERENIQSLIDAIFEQAPNNLEILVVDSASPDKTADAVREIQIKYPRVHLLEQRAKLGLGKAYLDGMQWVLARNYDCLITMDADFSHQPQYLKCHLKEIENHDLVIGSRYVKGGDVENWPKYRWMLSRFANWYATTLTGLPFQDLTSGFQCFRTALLKKILRYRIHTEGYAFLVELKLLSILQQAHYKEFPIIFANRRSGDSKISKRVIFESMFFVLARSVLRAKVRRNLKEFQLHRASDIVTAK